MALRVAAVSKVMNSAVRTTWSRVPNTFARGLRTTTNLVTFWTDIGGQTPKKPKTTARFKFIIGRDQNMI